MSHKKIISNIQKVRSLNNKYWMDILRVAFKYAPIEAAKIIKKINVPNVTIVTILFVLTR